LDSAVLDPDGFQYIRDIFAAISCSFQKFVNFFLFDQRNRIFLVGKQIAQQFAHPVLCLEFPAINLVAASRKFVRILHSLALESLDGFKHGLDALVDQPGYFRYACGRFHPESVKTIGCRIEMIENFIEKFREFMYILGVHRRDEGFVQSAVDGAHRFIAPDFKFSNLFRGAASEAACRYARSI
jgi:hypothetical protein